MGFSALYLSQSCVESMCLWLRKTSYLHIFLQGLALVMHKNREGTAVFVMLDKALEIARRENRVIEERNIRILIAQMHVVKVSHHQFF